MGLDFTLFNNRLSGRFEYYYKLTENTVLDYSLAPSIGFNITLPHEQYPNAWSTPAAPVFTASSRCMNR